MSECECEGQVRINNDCTYAKLVSKTSYYAFTYIYFNGLISRICKDGCYEEFTCEEEDEIIMVDMTNFRFSCGKVDTF